MKFPLRVYDEGELKTVIISTEGWETITLPRPSRETLEAAAKQIAAMFGVDPPAIREDW